MFFDGINTTQIFKNYYNALNDSSLDLKNCNSALSILEDDSKYNKFTSILFEGMSEDQLSIANSVCNAQRSFLIEEMERDEMIKKFKEEFNVELTLLKLKDSI